MDKIIVGIIALIGMVYILKMYIKFLRDDPYHGRP